MQQEQSTNFNPTKDTLSIEQQFQRLIQMDEIAQIKEHISASKQLRAYAIEQLIFEQSNNALIKFEQQHCLVSNKKATNAKFRAFQIVESLFSNLDSENDRNSGFGCNKAVEIDSSLKKCKHIHLFLLIAICKGYLSNLSIKRDRVKTFFMQMFKKNQAWFFKMQSFFDFHQQLVQRTTFNNASFKQNFNLSIANMNKQLNIARIEYFLDFFSEPKCRDFFPATLEIHNFILKTILSLRVDENQNQDNGQLALFNRLKQVYFLERHEHHLSTTMKNFRFIAEFFRVPFNQKQTVFFPQKSFIKLIIDKYTEHQIINMTVKQASVGLIWTEAQLSCCMANIFKLGLSKETLYLMKGFFQIGLNSRIVDSMLKICQNYITKVYIFMKFQKLFDVSLRFLYQMVLAPSVLVQSIFKKAVERSLKFLEKECPRSKRLDFLRFLHLTEMKYSSLSPTSSSPSTQTPPDTKNQFKSTFDELTNAIKLCKQTTDINFEEYKTETAKQILQSIEWSVDNKVSLFGGPRSGSSLSQLQNHKIKSTASDCEYKGLYNIGNSCYMNSFLQCLFMTIQLRKRVLDQSTLGLQQECLKKLHQQQKEQTANNQQNRMQIEQQQTAKPEVKSKPPAAASITATNTITTTTSRSLVRPFAQLQRLFSQLQQSARPSISPITIKNVSSAQFKNSYQQDTIQFGRSLLDMLLMRSMSSFNLQNFFEGEQTNEIKCMQCGVSRYNKEKFLDLMLNEVQLGQQLQYLSGEKREDEKDVVQRKDTKEFERMEKEKQMRTQQIKEQRLNQNHNHNETHQKQKKAQVKKSPDSLHQNSPRPQSQQSIFKMLKQLLSSQVIQNLTCDNCQAKSPKSQKHHYLTRLPNYLILTMKRFQYDLKANKNYKKHYQIDLSSQKVKVVNKCAGETTNGRHTTDKDESVKSFEQEQYQIYAIIVHRGQSANSGHYFAFAKEWLFSQDQQKQELKQQVKNRSNQSKQMQNKISEGKEKLNQFNDQNIEQFTNSSRKETDKKIDDDKIQVEQGDEQQEENRKGKQRSKQPKQQEYKRHMKQENQENQRQFQKLSPSYPNTTRWICFNDSVTSAFESFSSVRQFFQLNEEDTPYVIFLQKCSHIYGQSNQSHCNEKQLSAKQSHTSSHINNNQLLRQRIKLREPLLKFIQKDNLQYQKSLQQKSSSLKVVDWKNFGKVKGFTAYDYYQLTSRWGNGGGDPFNDDGNGGQGGGFGGGGGLGGGNMPIL